MNPVLIATISGLAVALSWGAADWLMAKNSRKFDKYQIILGMHLIGVTMMTTTLPFSHVVIPNANQILIIFLFSALITAALTLFIKALSSGAVGVIVPLSNAYPLITLGLGVIFIHTIFSGAQILAMIVVVIGAFLLGYEKNTHKLPVRQLYKNTILTLIAAACWGVAFFLLDFVVRDLPWQSVSWLRSLFMVLIILVVMTIMKKNKEILSIKKSFGSISITVMGILFALGTIAFFYGSAKAGSVVIPTVVGSSAPLVTSYLSYAYDNERIGSVKRMGAVTVVAGIIALNLL